MFTQFGLRTVKRLHNSVCCKNKDAKIFLLDKEEGTDVQYVPGLDSRRGASSRYLEKVVALLLWKDVARDAAVAKPAARDAAAASSGL